MQIPRVEGALYVGRLRQFLIVRRCPYCHKRHTHYAGEAGDSPSVGERAAPCAASGRRRYVVLWKGVRIKRWPGQRVYGSGTRA